MPGKLNIESMNVECFHIIKCLIFPLKLNLDSLVAHILEFFYSRIIYKNVIFCLNDSITLIAFHQLIAVLYLKKKKIIIKSLLLHIRYFSIPLPPNFRFRSGQLPKYLESVDERIRYILKKIFFFLTISYAFYRLPLIEINLKNNI